MPQVRISSGIVKNKRLKTPNIAGYRAVQEIVKLAVFSMLGEKINNATCLDLYAGSGNMGLEALSRGAVWCDFVDNNRLSEQAISENLRDCGFFENGNVYSVDAVKYVAETPNKYDVVFVDPFYSGVTHRFLIQNIAEILNDGGVVIFTHGKNLDMENLIKDLNFDMYTQRKYGNSILSILLKKPGQPETL